MHPLKKYILACYGNLTHASCARVLGLRLSSVMSTQIQLDLPTITRRMMNELDVEYVDDYKMNNKLNNKF